MAFGQATSGLPSSVPPVYTSGSFKLSSALSSAVAGENIVVAFSETAFSTLNVAATGVTISVLSGVTITKGFNGALITINADNVTIDGGIWDCNQAGGFTGGCVTSTSHSGFILRNAVVMNSAGECVHLSSVTGAQVINNKQIGPCLISGGTGDVSVNDNSTDWVVSGNHIDNLQDTVFARGISIHSNSVPNSVTTGAIANNVIENQDGFCIEVGNFGGYLVTGITITGNACYQKATSHLGTGVNANCGAAGGYSIADEVASFTGNSYRNETGQCMGFPGGELFGAANPMTGNSIEFANYTIYNTDSAFIGNSVFGGNIVIATGNNTGNPVAQRLIIAHNSVNTDAVVPGQAWVASTPLESNYWILDTNGNLERTVFRTSQAANTTGTTQPTWPTTYGAFTVDNNVTWQMMGLPPLTQYVTTPANNYAGIAVSCNTSGLICGPFLIDHNIITGFNLSADASINVSQTSGATVKDVIVDGNIITGWANAYDIGATPSLTTYLISNDDHGATALGTTNSAVYVPLGGRKPVAFASCAGTATSSTTLSFPTLGGNSFNCTSGVVNGTDGMVMTSSGSVSGLTVKCGTTGVNASSGAFGIYKNGTITAVALTYGNPTAGTLVQDTTHSATYAAGDMITIRFTTQASETLGACSASFNY